jgi:hypothetical protein
MNEKARRNPVLLITRGKQGPRSRNVQGDKARQDALSWLGFEILTIKFWCHFTPNLQNPRKEPKLAKSHKIK